MRIPHFSVLAGLALLVSVTTHLSVATAQSNVCPPGMVPGLPGGLLGATPEYYDPNDAYCMEPPDPDSIDYGSFTLPPEEDDSYIHIEVHEPEDSSLDDWDEGFYLVDIPAGEKLFLFAEPAFSAPKTGSLPAGTQGIEMKQLGEVRGVLWSRVCKNHLCGWAQPQALRKMQPVAPDTTNPVADSGWGVIVDEQAAEQRRLQEIIAANKVCDYQAAEHLAAEALKQYPGNRWLNQNYATLRTLAQRDRSFRQSMRLARLALDAKQITDSLTHLQAAMKNASIQCGQDLEVRGLHTEAMQMAAIQQQNTKRDLQQQAMEQAKRDQARFRADEKARLQSEADALAVQKALLETLGSMQKRENPQSQGNVNNDDADWLEKAVPDMENNTTWQQWLRNQ